MASKCYNQLTFSKFTNKKTQFCPSATCDWNKILSLTVHKTIHLLSQRNIIQYKGEMIICCSRIQTCFRGFLFIAVEETKMRETARSGPTHEGVPQ